MTWWVMILVGISGAWIVGVLFLAGMVWGDRNPTSYRSKPPPWHRDYLPVLIWPVMLIYALIRDRREAKTRS